MTVWEGGRVLPKYNLDVDYCVCVPLLGSVFGLSNVWIVIIRVHVF